jgi:hypothetical protein
VRITPYLGILRCRLLIKISLAIIALAFILLCISTRAKRKHTSRDKQEFFHGYENTKSPEIKKTPHKSSPPAREGTDWSRRRTIRGGLPAQSTPVIARDEAISRNANPIHEGCRIGHDHQQFEFSNEGYF